MIKSNTSISLVCTASGVGTIEYQWQKYNNDVWMNIGNSNTAEYETDRLTESSQYRCVVSNRAGEVISVAKILVLGNKHIA